MINKFKNVLKVGKKSKDVEEALKSELSNDDVKVTEEQEEPTTENIEVEQVENLENLEETNDEEVIHFGDSVEQDEEESFGSEEAEEVDFEAQESVFRVEATEGKSVKDADIPLEEYNLQELVCSTLKQFAPMIIKKGIRLELDGLDTKITTNEEVLLFIFQEILSNAVNSLVEGSIKIHLNEGRLYFEDTGYGIPSDEVSLIFDEGYMASNAAPSDDLEGMGMYKCSIALEKMYYGYEIRSTQGKGTSFIIDLS